MATITDKAMQARPADADQWLIEDGARGEGRFVGRITPAGGRSFYFRYTGPSGDRVRLPIGSYDPRGDGGSGFTVAQARDKARELAALYRSGVRDLRGHLEQQVADRRQAEEAARRAADAADREAVEAAAALARLKTVRQAFETWRATELQPRIVGDGERRGRKDGGAQTASQFERYLFPDHGGKLLQNLKRADILACVDKATSDGKLRLAAVLYADIRQMLNFALVREIISVDPMAGLKRSRIVGKPVRRDRALSDAEITELAGALPHARMNPRSAAAVWLILATGTRLGEAMGATWADGLPTEPKKRRARMEALQVMADAEDVKLGLVDIAARTWHLPTTKNQRPHTIHLSDFALARLAELRDLRELVPGVDGAESAPSPWLFAGTDPARPVCPASLGKQIADRQKSDTDDEATRWKGRSKAREALRLEGGRWTVHDLRRTAATVMARLGISSDVIHECLNHRPADELTAIYVRDRREAEQQRAFDALGQRLAELVDGQPAGDGNVVLLPQRAA